jgi:hypothetical protein
MKKFTIQLETLKTTRFFIFTKTFLNDECPICFDNILPETRAKVGCNHSFCINCIKEHIIYSENKKLLTCPCCRQTITNMKLLNKTEMNNIKNLVNVPQKYNERERRADESRFSEIRLYERRQGRFIVVRSTDARI